jgi:large conductance mechanosensitive channel
MLKEFKKFLVRSNAMALAIGVIFGAAAGKIVTSLVNDIIMPIIGVILPSKDWQSNQLVLGTTTDAAGKVTVAAIKYGDFFGSIIDFIFIGLVLFLLAKFLVKDAMPADAPPSKECPFCKESIAKAATKCKFCASEVA